MGRFFCPSVYFTFKWKGDIFLLHKHNTKSIMNEKFFLHIYQNKQNKRILALVLVLIYNESKLIYGLRYETLAAKYINCPNHFEIQLSLSIL